MSTTVTTPVPALPKAPNKLFARFAVDRSKENAGAWKPYPIDDEGTTVDLCIRSQLSPAVRAVIKRAWKDARTQMAALDAQIEAAEKAGTSTDALEAAKLAVSDGVNLTILAEAIVIDWRFPSMGDAFAHALPDADNNPLPPTPENIRALFTQMPELAALAQADSGREDAFRRYTVETMAGNSAAPSATSSVAGTSAPSEATPSEAPMELPTETTPTTATA